MQVSVFVLSSILITHHSTVLPTTPFPSPSAHPSEQGGGHCGQLPGSSTAAVAPGGHSLSHCAEGGGDSIPAHGGVHHVSKHVHDIPRAGAPGVGQASPPGAADTFMVRVLGQVE